MNSGFHTKRALGRAVGIVIGLSSILPGPIPAKAALLQGVSGRVVVNQGEGFEPVKGPINLVPDDQVVVGPDGTATLSYGNGCDVAVTPETVVSVARDCPVQIPGNATGQQVLTQAANPGAPVDPNAPPVNPNAPPVDPNAPPVDPNAGGIGGISGTTLAVGAGVAVAVGVGVAIAASSGKSKGASP